MSREEGAQRQTPRAGGEQALGAEGLGTRPLEDRSAGGEHLRGVNIEAKLWGGGCGQCWWMGEASGWTLESQVLGLGLEQFSSIVLPECVFPSKALGCPVAGRLLS